MTSDLIPLRQGDWRPETAKEKTAQIEIDLMGKFGSRTIESMDKFELQTHVDHLARTYCQDRVKQARSYLKSIFDEVIEQEFLVRDPTRTLKIPKNLRPEGQADSDLGTDASHSGEGRPKRSPDSHAGYDGCPSSQ